MAKKVRRAAAPAEGGRATSPAASTRPKAKKGATAAAPSGAAALRGLVDGLAARLDFGGTGGGGGAEAVEAAVKAAAKAQAPELAAVLRQLLQRLAGLRTAAGAALERFEPSAGGAADPASSASYVEMKVQLLLSYVICLVYYLLLKARGVPVSGHPVVPRLLWIRSLLEKLRPVDQRLQYQMGKLLQWADSKAGRPGGDAADPRSMRPGELAASVEDDGEEGEDAEGEDAEAGYGAGDGVYRPPKVSQVEYTGDHVSMQEKAERDLERKKGRLERSEFMRSLREEFTDAPAEIHGQRKSMKAEKAARMMSEQTEYEEDHMLRLRTSKKEAKVRARVMREGRATGAGVATLDDITADFRDVARSARTKRLPAGRKGRGGSALEEYQAANERARGARGVVASTLDGPDAALGGGKGAGKRRGPGGTGGGGLGDGKRRRR